MKLWVIARFTFREARRRKLLWVGLGLGILFLVLFALGFSLIYREMQVDIGRSPETRKMLEFAVGQFEMAALFVINFLIVLTAILTTITALPGEISSHTIYAVITKPVRRWEVLLGKWLGHAMMLTAYVLLLAGGVMLIVYFIAGYVPRHPIRGLALLVLEGLVLTSLTFLGGTRLSSLVNGVVVFMLYGLAFIGGWVEQFGSLLGNRTAVRLGHLPAIVVPSEALWRLASHTMSPLPPLGVDFTPGGSLFAFGRPPAASTARYGVVYVIVVLFLATLSFRRRDL
ncbi:MAG: ABC transporter permease [Chloroflexi bacterium]|nr:MAG: ABC transporter permease [Chloroflexota bacterium]